MNIQLNQTEAGGLIIAGDEPFPHEIRHVEYHRDQKLMLLVYDNEEQDDELMHYEIPDSAVDNIESSPSILIITYKPDRKIYGYDVPLIRVGDVISRPY